MLLLFFSNSVWADPCGLPNIFQELSWKKGYESLNEHFRRIQPFTYSDEEKLKAEYLKKKNDENGYLNTIGSLDDYINADLYQRIMWLTVISQPSHYAELCNEENAVLKLKVDAQVVDERWSRLELFFKKVNGDFLFEYAKPETSLNLESFDKDIHYRVWSKAR